MHSPTEHRPTFTTASTSCPSEPSRGDNGPRPRQYLYGLAGPGTRRRVSDRSRLSLKQRARFGLVRPPGPPHAKLGRLPRLTDLVTRFVIRTLGHGVIPDESSKTRAGSVRRSGGTSAIRAGLCETAACRLITQRSIHQGHRDAPRLPADTVFQAPPNMIIISESSAEATLLVRTGHYTTARLRSQRNSMTLEGTRPYGESVFTPQRSTDVRSAMVTPRRFALSSQAEGIFWVVGQGLQPWRASADGLAPRIVAGV